MIRPGQRCLIVCSSSESRFAGQEVIAVRPLGPGVIILHDRSILEVTDAWHIDPGYLSPDPYLWAAREKWLVPIDGEPDDEMIRDTIRTAFELGVDA